MSDIIERRKKKMECGYGICYGKAGRSFLTKEEKMEMLKEYKEGLEREAKGVGERIAQLNEKE